MSVKMTVFCYTALKLKQIMHQNESTVRNNEQTFSSSTFFKPFFKPVSKMYAFKEQLSWSHSTHKHAADACVVSPPPPLTQFFLVIQHEPVFKRLIHRVKTKSNSQLPYYTNVWSFNFQSGSDRQMWLPWSPNKPLMAALFLFDLGFVSLYIKFFLRWDFEPQKMFSFSVSAF